jgi:hypothetical protein
MKKGVMILFSLIFLIGAGCEQGFKGEYKCDSISDEDERNNCWDAHNFEEAVKLKNSVLCDNILDSELKSKCSKGLNPNVEEAAFKKSQDDVKACEDLIGGDRTVCEDNHYFNQAQREGDLSLCEMISDKVVMEVCLSS